MTETHASLMKDSPISVRVAIIGAAGQLGTALCASVPPGVAAIPVTRNEVDITDMDTVLSSPLLSDVDVIINAAAYTDVDGAEADSGAAHLVNATGAKNIALRAKKENAFLIHVSTDYVFGDGVDQRASESQGLLPTDPKVPSTMYGRTKLVGENHVVDSGARAAIVRTAWVWSGPTQPKAKDFVSTMMRLAADPEGYPSVKVVSDQHGNPTFVGDLAASLWELALHPVTGVFHAVGAEPTTWYEFARAIFDAVHADPTRVVPCTSEEFPRPAKRPRWSVLDTTAWEAAGLQPLPEWQDTLARVLS